MNVLVTGGAGYIGSHTCVELIEAGHTPIVIDNLSNSNPESLHRVAEITGKPVEFIEGDVRDEALLEKIFAEHEFSCAIHFAGLKAVGESVAKPMDYYQNNLDATLMLCKVMAKHNVKRIIFSSSATVYSGDNEMPLRETSKTGNCTNPYGWTKYMGEQILRDIAKADPEWSVVNLRYFNPVGAHESGKIGEHPNGIPNNLMPYISQTAIGKRDHLNVFGNDYPTPDGTGVRDYRRNMPCFPKAFYRAPRCSSKTGNHRIRRLRSISEQSADRKVLSRARLDKLSGAIAGADL